MVPAHRHKEPEVVAAKRDELQKWEEFNAYTIVNDEGQERITTRWVINEKQEHDGLKVKIKAMLCLRGFQESEKPRSDSPTSALIKIVLAVAANEGWRGECMDITSAFLQSERIQRSVYVTLPKEVQRDGELAVVHENS